eukprot:5128359-Amphidinium_carterae.4
MKGAGLSEGQIKQAFHYFDERAPQHFNRPNLRNLTDLQQQLPQLRQVYEVEQGDYSGMEEEDEFDEYDTSHQSARTTSASGSNIQQREVKRKSTKGSGK